MGRVYTVHLSGARIWSCQSCQTHLAFNEEIISKSFQGKHGKAYLFTSVVNVCVGKTEDRHLMTGLHTVSDIHCVRCNTVLGWKYDVAYEESQKYKEGKFIIERALVSKERSWS